MALEYVSWKQGDPAIKADPQTIKPKTWTNLKFGSNGDVIVPKNNGSALWSVYLNIDADGGASDAVVTSITKRVNGGTIGLPDRIKHFREYYNLLK